MPGRLALAGLLALGTTLPLSAVGEASAQEMPRVHISEVLANSGNGAQDAGFEWFEIHNASSAPLRLDGWSIADNTASDPLPPIVIPPDEFVVVLATDDALPETVGIVHVVIADGRIGNGLANSGDRLLLVNPAGETVDALSWGSDRSVNDLAPPPAGQSLMRDLVSLMFRVGSPTPGERPPAPVDSAGQPPPLRITEIYAHAGQGTRDAAFEWVEIFNPTSEDVDLQGWLIADNAASDALTGVIPGMSYVVLVPGVDAIDASSGVPTLLVADGRIGNGLANGGDTLTLLDPAGRVVDRVDFTGPPLPRPERDRSIARLDDGWVLNTEPTPGRAGATPLLAGLAGVADAGPNPSEPTTPVRLLPDEGGGLPAWALILIAAGIPLATLTGRSLYRRARPPDGAS